MRSYLDHAATTPLRAEARDAWLEAAGVLGNASSIHTAGQTARRSLEESRERLAEALDCDPVEVVFTSGGTEAVNLGITGLYRAQRERTGRTVVVASAAEHHATIDTLSWLTAHEDARAEWVGVNAAARVHLDAWRAAVGSTGMPDGRVATATMLAANNETGTIQPVTEAAEACVAADVPMHLDAVGAFGHAPLSFRLLRQRSGSSSVGLVAMSVAAHKLGGPIGVGALVVSRAAHLEPLLHGGGQQRGLRAGTQDAAGAAAFAVAAELAVADMAREAARLAALRDRLEAGVRSGVPDSLITAADAQRLPGHLHVVFPGAQGDSLLLLLDMAGIAVSAGSACQAGTPEPSHVVRAMGLGDEAARSAVRFTLGATSTDADVAAVLAVLPDVYERARAAGLSSRRVAAPASRRFSGSGSGSGSGS